MLEGKFLPYSKKQVGRLLPTYLRKKPGWTYILFHYNQTNFIVLFGKIIFAMFYNFIPFIFAAKLHE